MQIYFFMIHCNIPTVKNQFYHLVSSCDMHCWIYLNVEYTWGCNHGGNRDNNLKIKWLNVMMMTMMITKMIQDSILLNKKNYYYFICSDSLFCYSSTSFSFHFNFCFFFNFKLINHQFLAIYILLTKNVAWFYGFHLHIAMG